MKVQKLLYYAQSLHLALFDEPLFNEEMQAWRYGPVCPPAYHFYRDFKANPLLVPTKSDLQKVPEQAQNLLAEVWEYFGEYNAYYLSGMTHVEFPWKKARKGLPADANSREPILLDDMQTLGHHKLEEIERSHPFYQKIVPALLEATCSETQDKTYVKQGKVHDWLNSLLA